MSRLLQVVVALLWPCLSCHDAILLEADPPTQAASDASLEDRQTASDSNLADLVIPDLQTDPGSVDANTDAGFTDAGSVDTPNCGAVCGISCPSVEFWLCGADGNYYCNECYLSCNGVQLADNDAVCDL